MWPLCPEPSTPKVDMTYKHDDLLKIMKEELGYAEKSNGFSKFGDWYGKNVDKDPVFSTAPWCDMFISWAADKAGMKEAVGQFAYTVDHAKWFEEQGAWSDEPTPGAIIFYDYGGSKDIGNIDHVGIVEKVKGDQIHTIEGNVDGGNLKRKVREDSIIVGYGHPEKVARKIEAAEDKAKSKDESDAVSDAKDALTGGPGGSGTAGTTAMTTTSTNAASFTPTSNTMSDPQQVVFSGLLVLLLAMIYVTGVLAKAQVPALTARVRESFQVRAQALPRVRRNGRHHHGRDTGPSSR
jgi:surface antigen